MTISDRDELFAALAELAQRYPHWRIGQLVCNVAGWSDTELWDTEDAQLLAAAREHLIASLADKRDSGGVQTLHRNGSAQCPLVG